MAGVVWPSYHVTNVRAAAADTDRNVMGKDAFLNLLVTQLRNQNPLEPLSNTEYIAQMAQFTSVEQLMNLVTEMSALRNNLGIASGMIGMSVTWSELDQATGQLMTYRGIVDSIIVRDGVTMAKVGDRELSLDSISSMSLPGGGGTDG
ncbi:flagellar hook capping protein [Thermobacillus composti KWC4]|uniref:Flagellar hook capping protein n=1 Tax=Thermobacillus composti (strain DSM 18247 / JCM 13945 / KWC4) TaxID=717605 RepID=L0EGD0_THECK|nr:flagellar hook capping FlgD N-terminal domain-containing protein [Thermobacillus composti]AGA58220.1 flagellar hook capping protein [Thermobacillus composti KWC4]